MVRLTVTLDSALSLNESPSEKEGKCPIAAGGGRGYGPSMKVPPKRKGNTLYSSSSYVSYTPQ